MRPDLHLPFVVPEDLMPFVRRILVAISDRPIEITSDVPATGYCYLGWTPHGRWTGTVNGKMMFDTSKDGPLHLSGQIKDSVVKIQLTGELQQVFVELAATAQSALFGVDGIETVERAIPLQSVVSTKLPLPPNVTEDAEKLAEPVIELLRSFAQDPHPVPTYVTGAVARFEASAGQDRVAEVARHLQVSERQLSRDFHRIVGLTPKRFCRVVQINSALGKLLAKGPARLAELAIEHGFSDQSHMTRSFAQYLGRRPRTLADQIEPMWARFVGQSQSANVAKKDGS